MTTQLDSTLPAIATAQIARFGATASLYTSRDGEATAAGIKVTPAKRKMVVRPGTAIYDEVSQVLVAAGDPKLSGFPLPPQPGDLLTYHGNVYPLIEGTGPIDSGDATAVYVLRFKRTR